MKNIEKPLTPEELMKAMNSTKGSDPIPPDQYLYFRHDRDPEQRTLAEYRAHTIRHGHRRPYVCDTKGHPLSLTDISKLVGIDPRNLTKVNQGLANKGLIRIDHRPYRVYLCGKISEEKAKIVSDVESETYIIPNTRKSWTPYELPSYILRLVGEWPKERRETFFAKRKVWWESRQNRIAEALTKVRIELTTEEDSLFAEFGLPKKRKLGDNTDEQNTKGNKKRKSSTPNANLRLAPMIPSSLPVNGNHHEPEPLTPMAPDLRFSSGILHRKKESVAAASGVQFTNGQNGYHTPPHEPDPEAQNILEALRVYARCDLEAAQTLLSACRKEEAGCTIRAILEAVKVKAEAFKRKGNVENRIGFLITQVPKLFAPAAREADARQPITATEQFWERERVTLETRKQMAREVASTYPENQTVQNWAEGIFKEG